MATGGALGWLRRNLFADWSSAIATLTIIAALLYYVPPFIDWAVVNAVTRPDNAACRALEHAGACWGVIAEKYRLILFGRYPFDRAMAAAGGDAADGRDAGRKLHAAAVEPMAGRSRGSIVFARVLRPDARRRSRLVAGRDRPLGRAAADAAAVHDRHRGRVPARRSGRAGTAVAPACAAHASASSTSS